MAISSLGAGSGLDLNGILQSIYSQATAGTKALDSKTTTINTKISDLGRLQNSLSDLRSSLASLGTPAGRSALAGVAATPSDASAISASVTGAASAGHYSISVSALASSGKIASDARVVDPNAAIGSGTLTVNLGSISGGTLGADGKYTGASYASSKSASFDLSSASLNDVKDALNKTGLVSANLINDGSGYRLSIQSLATGSDQSIKIQASAGSDASIQSFFNYDPAGSQAFKQTQKASDLTANVDGIDITQKSNRLDEAIGGVSFDVKKAGSFSLDVAADTGAAEKAVGSFVEKWNAFNALVTSGTAYNPSTKTTGNLFGESSVGMVARQARQAVFGSNFSTGNNFKTLMSVGISVDAKGVATLDATKLKKALAIDPSALDKLFSTQAGNASSALNSLEKNNSSTSSSGLQSAIKVLGKNAESLAVQRQRILDLAETQQKTLSRQFSALDSLVGANNSLSSFLSQNFK